jgi:RND family efflux transporter MFP subunit
MVRKLMIAVVSGVLLVQPVFAASLETTAASRMQIPRVYHLDGVVDASNRSTVSAQTSGQIREVLFDVDDVVQQGAVIVTIEDTEQQANLASARANLQSARAQLAEAQAEYDRTARVFAKQAVSQAVMDKATAALKSARAGVDAARAELAQAEQQLEYTQVTAPYTGIVTERHAEVGEMASRGQPLMSGLSLQQLRVEVDVPQSLIGAVRQEQGAMVRVDGRWIEATGMTVFPVADPATDSFRVRLDLPEGVEGVFPGMYVKVAMHVGVHTELVVPRSAVVYRSEVIGVYVVDADGRVWLRHVRLGRSLPDGRHTIISGLAAGERVALDPQAAVETLKAQREGRAGNE